MSPPIGIHTDPPPIAAALTHRYSEPFSKLEIRAQVSFVFDNPALPLQSRKTWEQFIKETGSKRAPDSLKSTCSSVAFLRCSFSLLRSVPRPCPCAPFSPAFSS
jgi:hypothetical protein